MRLLFRSVFLKQDVAGERPTALAEERRDRRNVSDVQLLTPEQGLQSLRDTGVPAPAIDAAGDNPLPYVLVVTPAGDAMMLAAGLAQMPEAALVQPDTPCPARLERWSRFGGRGAWRLAYSPGLGRPVGVGNPL